MDATDLVTLHPGTYASAGGTSERISLVLAIVDMSKAGGIHGLAEEHEDLKSVILPADDFLEMAHTGKIRDMSTFAAAHCLEQRRSKLRRDFSKAVQKKKEKKPRPAKPPQP